MAQPNDHVSNLALIIEHLSIFCGKNTFPFATQNFFPPNTHLFKGPWISKFIPASVSVGALKEPLERL